MVIETDQVLARKLKANRPPQSSTEVRHIANARSGGGRRSVMHHNA
jgi:hypothetical protein